VTDLPRLAGELHAGIDAFVSLARTHAERRDRTDAIGRGMFDYFYERLQTHGYPGSREQARAVLGFDVRINTMGLDVWLKRAARKPH
jgi:hypothetical protein